MPTFQKDILSDVSGSAAREEAHKLIKAGKTPVFCGGTGLYLDWNYRPDGLLQAQSSLLYVLVMAQKLVLRAYLTTKMQQVQSLFIK